MSKSLSLFTFVLLSTMLIPFSMMDAHATTPVCLADNVDGTVFGPINACDFETIIPMLIEDGLPVTNPPTTIEINAMFMPDPSVIATGNPLSGETEITTEIIQMTLTGTGDLAGFNRVISVQTAPDSKIAESDPRTPFDPIQNFPTELIELEGSLFGDPDFDSITLRIGGSFGLPSLGETTLTDIGGGKFIVDSFFDIEYEIEYQGAPGSALEGFGGISQGQSRIEEKPNDDHPPAPITSFGDFACWELNPLNLPSIPLFSIEDQFGIIENANWRVTQYCAAAEKRVDLEQFDSPFAPLLDQHYQGFLYPDDTRGAGTDQIVILDVPQFGHTFQTTLGFVDSILVPTSKELLGGDIIDSQDNEQHWNCYEILEPFVAGPIDVNTQHGSMVAVIDEAFLMCAPMIKTDVQAQQQFGALIDEHMVCYDLIPIADNSVNLPIALSNQLSGFQFAPIEINEVEKFCAPAFKTVITPPTVGGLDVSINTSALLLAGVQSISMWMIPVVIAGVGIGIFVIKKRN